VNDQPPQPPAEPQPPAPAPQQPYTPPPLPPGYEQHYRPIYPQYTPKPPGNDSAVASIIVACTSIGFLILSVGLLAPLTLIGSAISIPLGHAGKRNVDEGKTKQNRDIAVAGFWTGIAGVALALVAIIAWIVIVIVALNSDVSWTDDHGRMHQWSFN
jgi:hypothetical protein